MGIETLKYLRNILREKDNKSKMKLVQMKRNRRIILKIIPNINNNKIFTKVSTVLLRNLLKIIMSIKYQ